MAGNETPTMVATDGLRDLRKAAELSIGKASEAIKVSKGLLSRYERCERRLPARLVSAIAAAYGTTVTQVLAANERDWLRHDGGTPAPKRTRRKTPA